MEPRRSPQSHPSHPPPPSGPPRQSSSLGDATTPRPSKKNSASGPTAQPPASSRNTPPLQQKPKGHVHVVLASGATRPHKRVSSGKVPSNTKTTPTKPTVGSHDNLKRLASSSRTHSTASLKKNLSQTVLKRNHSSTDVAKRAKPAAAPTQQAQAKKSTLVHFEIGADLDDGWEEASSTASPAVSRSASRPSSRQSTKHSASNSRPESPLAQRSPSF